MIVKIKPLSVNKLFQGRRFRTKEYDRYQKDVFWQLKPMAIPDTKLKLKITVAFSNKAADLDNSLKAFQDILQKFYHFNDSQIYAIDATKVIVKKGHEFIDFEILEFNQP